MHTCRAVHIMIAEGWRGHLSRWLDLNQEERGNFVGAMINGARGWRDKRRLPRVESELQPALYHENDLQ